MKPAAMLEQLEQLAEALEVKVSYEALNASVGHGGLCRVKGQYRVIVDKRASVHERLGTLAQALGRFDSSEIKLPAKVRELVDYHRRRYRIQQQRQARAQQKHQQEQQRQAGKRSAPRRAPTDRGGATRVAAPSPGR
ncbi:hypothetical protein [Haliangium ochraceum]|uniref:Uncharacterized protein n=1 Tax=Haliangium ochraceum (strain DSM 14365 / JCM 11303 / SMP-2) TaxID=502025 RepID=D0LRH3_HALO1|nr:hypothetical protein [Haliangium ochraceum]ACY17201.1 hypothetical protein Hoch_4711 [Haliangium ochraceum DSM 14365]